MQGKEKSNENCSRRKKNSKFFRFFLREAIEQKMRESSPERAEASADAQGSACHVGSAVWVAEGTGSASEGAPAVPSSRKKPGRWLKGTVVAVGGTSLSSRTLTVETEDGRTLAGVPESDCPLQNSRDDTLDDLVRADFLHEPGYVLWSFFVDAPLKRKKRAIDFFLSVHASCFLFRSYFVVLLSSALSSFSVRGKRCVFEIPG